MTLLFAHAYTDPRTLPAVDRSRVNEYGRVITNGRGWVIGHSNDSELAAWNFNNAGAGSQLIGPYPGQVGYTYEHNAPIALYNTPGARYDNNSYGQWTWRAPRRSWIYRVDFANVDHSTAYPNAMCLAMGIYSVTRYNWEAGNMFNGYGQYVGRSPWIGGPSPGGSCSAHTDDNKSHQSYSPTPGNLAVYQMFAYGSGVRPYQSVSVMDGAGVFLDDAQAPSVSAATTAPGGWVRSANVTTTVNTRDAAPGTGYEQGGLGMWIDALFVPVEGGASAQQTAYLPCNRGGVVRITRCDEYATFTHTYSTEDANPDPNITQRMPSGINTIYGDAYDATGKPTRYQAGTVKIDRTPPDAGSISGVAEGELLRDRDYTITGTASDNLSGAKEVQVTLAGPNDAAEVRKAFRSDCPSTTSPCTVPFTLDGGDPNLTPGTHTLRVKVRDHAGNGYATVATRTLKVERTKPTIDVEGSLKPEGTNWVALGEQDLLFDAFDEGGTGVVSAKLKIDGAVVEAAPPQSCDQGGCTLSHDFYAATDGFAPGEHEVSVEVTDGAGNVASAANTPEARWPIRLERDQPDLVLSGSLSDARAQTLQAGQTYSLSALASEPVGMAGQSQMGALEFSVDGDVVEIQEQGCELGACPMSRTFEYVVDEHAEGQHEIALKAIDFAGNERTETFTVGNPSPPAPTCGPPAEDQSSASLLALDPLIVEPLFRAAFPAGFAPSSPVNLRDLEIRPGLGSDLRSARTVADTRFGTTSDRSATSTTEAPERPACLEALDTSSAASNPVLVKDSAGDGAAALYANSSPATDTLLRPSATGSFTVNHIRNSLAPTTFSWDVDLDPGQQLDVLEGGTAAVIEPAEEGTSAPPMIEGLAAAPTIAERKASLSDTASQVGQASDALERAQGDNPDRIVALIPPPWAEDAAGNPIATSLAVAGSTITMQVTHTLTDAYPVVAGHQFITRDAVDEYETLKAGASVGDYALDERTEPAAGPVGVGGPPPGPEDDGGSVEPEDTSGVDAIDDQPVIGQQEDVALPEATSDPKQVDAASARNLPVGISAISAATIRNSDLFDEPGALDPPFVRPIAPWNFIAKDPDFVEDPNRLGCGRFMHGQWKSFAAEAERRRLRVDLAINTDARLGLGGTTNITPRGYRNQLVALLERYGHRPDGPDAGTEPDQHGIIDNLTAWNEPQYFGSNRPKTCPGGRNGTNRGNPLKRKPLLAARLWVQAMSACFPGGSPGNPAPPAAARCGHYDQGGVWGPGQVVAGEYAGTRKAFPQRFYGARKSYVEHYRSEIERVNKRLYFIGYQEHMPRVWSFHNYGDFKTFALSGRRAARDLPITNHFTRLYDGERYEWRDGTGERQPEIWVTEAGGVNYSFNCKSVPEGRRLKFCDGQDERIALLGMPRQAATLAFFLKAYGNRSGPPGRVGLIDRVYYFQLLTRAECGIKRLGDFKCSLSEFGLLGSADDDLFRSAVQRNDRTYVVPTPPRSATEPNDRFYSKPGERRFSFCLLRDRSPRWLTKPSRINRSNCPG